MKHILITIAAMLLVIQLGFGLATCVYKVDRREHAVVFRLGKYTGAPVTEQGLPALLEPHDMVDVSFPLMPYKDGLFHFGPVMVP